MTAPVHEGQVLAGKYRVERVLGEGGMGVVVAARHLQLGQSVALKFLLPAACTQIEAVTRFLHEARAVARLETEHVARVSDVGTLESGAPYMVMEHLRGSDFAAVLRERRSLPIAEAVGYLLQAMEAVAEAHSIGIVHRDLKPSNLFLTRRPDGSPFVKVLDFGVSKALDPEILQGGVANVTASNAVLGSPHYMSPEQIRTPTKIDQRTDIWSLGMILHELVCGNPAFEAESVPALLAMIVADPPIPLRVRLPAAPAALEAVILACLEKDRERRIPNVAELARALEPFAPPEALTSIVRIGRILGAAASSRFTPSPVPAISAASTDTAPAPRDVRSPQRGKRVLVVLLALAGVAVIALLWSRQRAAFRTLEEPKVPVTAVHAAAPVPPRTETSTVTPRATELPSSTPSGAKLASGAPSAVAPISAVSARPARAKPRARSKRDLFQDAK